MGERLFFEIQVVPLALTCPAIWFVGSEEIRKKLVLGWRWRPACGASLDPGSATRSQPLWQIASAMHQTPRFDCVSFGTIEDDQFVEGPSDSN